MSGQLQVLDKQGQVVSRPPQIGSAKRTFCLELRVSNNLRKAIVAAKIKSVPRCPSKDPLRMGCALLGDPLVQSYLEYLSNKPQPGLHADAARVREELSAVAFSSLGDFIEFEVDAQGNSTGKFKGIRLDWGDMRALQAIEVTDTGTGANRRQHVKLRAHPKIEAMKLVGQESGMFTEETRKAPNISIAIHLDGINGSPKIVDARP